MPEYCSSIEEKGNGLLTVVDDPVDHDPRKTRQDTRQDTKRETLKNALVVQRGGCRGKVTRCVGGEVEECSDQKTPRASHRNFYYADSGLYSSGSCDD